MSQTTAHLVDHVIPHVPVRQWVLSLPIPLRVLLAARPVLITPVLPVVQRLVTRHLLATAGLSAVEGHGGSVTLIQRFGYSANLNIHQHRLVLDGVYRSDADDAHSIVEVSAPTDDGLHGQLQTVIARLMKMLTRRGVLVEDMGQSWPGRAETQDTVARRNHAPGDEPAGVHAAAGRAGATAQAAAHLVPRRDGSQCQAAGAGGATGARGGRASCRSTIARRHGRQVQAPQTAAGPSQVDPEGVCNCDAFWPAG